MAVLDAFEDNEFDLEFMLELQIITENGNESKPIVCLAQKVI